MKRLAKLFEEAITNYNKTKNITLLIHAFEKICKLYRDFFGIGDILLSYGESLIKKEESEAGIAILRLVEKHFKFVANEALFCLRLADAAFKSGDEERGRSYLMRLVKTIDNYEEAIEFNGLSEIWNAHKSKLMDLPPSVRTKETRACTPEECSHSMQEILSFPESTMLSAISEHLGELCADGEKPELLTAEEQTVFFIDEWITSVNADGIFHYLNDRGHHFEMLIASAKALNSKNLQNLLFMVENKLSRNKILKNLEKIQIFLEKAENAGVDFEAEEAFYYQDVQEVLLDTLACYIRQNSHAFR